MIALLFALKGKGSTGIGALISSKVNQWTLLVGAIPLAYGLAANGLQPMILDSRSKEELLLTSAQSLFAAVIISDFKFTVWEAMLLLILVSVQLVLPSERYIFCILYLLASFVLLVLSKTRRDMMIRALTLK